MQNLNIENDRNEQERDESFELLVQEVGVYRAVQIRAKNGLLRPVDVNRLSFSGASSLIRKPELDDRIKIWLVLRMLTKAETFAHGLSLYRLPSAFVQEREVGWRLMRQKGSFNDWHSIIQRVPMSYETRDETETGKFLDAAEEKAQTAQEWQALAQKAGSPERRRRYAERAFRATATTKEVLDVARLHMQSRNPERIVETVFRAAQLAKSLEDWMQIRLQASKDGEVYRLADAKVRQLAVGLNDLVNICSRFGRDSDLHKWALSAVESSEASFDEWRDLLQHVVRNGNTVELCPLLLEKTFARADSFERWHGLWERYCKDGGCSQQIYDLIWNGLRETAATFDDWRWILGHEARRATPTPARERALQEMRRLGTREDWVAALKTVREEWRNTELLEPALDCLAALDREAHARRNQTATQEDNAGAGIVFD